MQTVVPVCSDVILFLWFLYMEENHQTLYFEDREELI